MSILQGFLMKRTNLKQSDEKSSKLNILNEDFKYLIFGVLLKRLWLELLMCLFCKVSWWKDLPSGNVTKKDQNWAYWIRTFHICFSECHNKVCSLETLHVHFAMFPYEENYFKAWCRGKIKIEHVESGLLIVAFQSAITNL